MDKVQAEPTASPPVPDFEQLSRNMAQFVEEAGKATAAYLKPLEQKDGGPPPPDGVAEIVRTLGQVAEAWMVDPQ